MEGNQFIATIARMTQNPDDDSDAGSTLNQLIGMAREIEPKESAVPELIEALQAALPRVAHVEGCLTLLPTEQWTKEHGNYSDEHCHCVRKKIKDALRKAGVIE